MQYHSNVITVCDLICNYVLFAFVIAAIDMHSFCLLVCNDAHNYNYEVLTFFAVYHTLALAMYIYNARTH